MECPACGFAYPETFNFCSRCGCRLTHLLTAETPPVDFNANLEKLQRYLPRGISQKILSHKERLEGERRQVTVLFCDMAGFTQMVARLDTEEAYKTMDNVYEILIHSVHEFEGTVNEMTGDGIMALFGAPTALEDAPQRAIRSAIAIHRNIAAYSSQNERIGPIRMRIGINTGWVIVGTLGNDLRLEFKAVGGTVNLAARLEQLAEPGTTFVSWATHKLTRDFFHFEKVGQKFVKGHKDPITIYKVVSTHQEDRRSRLGAERMIYSRLIGRQGELDRLELQLMKVIDGQGSIISIIGEAGIGKSRLVAELQQREAIQNRVTFLEGRTVAIGRNLGLHPIIDLLKKWAGISHEDPNTVAFDKLQAALQKLFPEEYRRRLAVAASLMGLQSESLDDNWVGAIEGESLKKLMLENVRELLSRTARQMPLVIIIEDLQWADASSIELLEALFDLARSERIVFINAFRPGFKNTGERILQSINESLSAYHLEIVLNPLDEQKCESLVSNMLSYSALDHAIMAQIVSRAGGNPYFIEEIVRAMIDEGALSVKGGIFKATDKMSSVIIPNTINDVLMSRIDQLEEATRDVVMIAAIIGRNFKACIIREVAEGIDAIDTRLACLKEMQIISECQGTGEIEYRFKHGLAQEAIYFSMLPEKRRKLHLRVAQSIERNFADKLHEYYGILSYHFNKGRDFDQAEAYMLMAGNEAMKISASSEALNYYQTAMEFYIKKCGDAADKIKIAAMEENIAIAFFSKGNFVEAAQYFERSLKNLGVKRPQNAFQVKGGTLINLLRIVKSLYIPGRSKKKRPSDADIRIMNLKWKLAMSLSYVDINRVFVDNIGNVPQAFKLDIRKAPVYVDALLGLSALFAVTGISFSLSRKILHYVDETLCNEDHDARVPKNFYRFSESLHNCLIGHWQHPFNPADIENALKVGDVSYASGTLFWLGYAKLERGDLEATQQIIALEDEIAHRYHFENAKVDANLLAAKLAIVNGDLSKAKDHIDEGFTILLKFDQDMRKIEFNGLKIKVCVLEKDLGAAGKVVRECEDLLIKVGKRAILPNYYGEYLIGHLRYCLGKLEGSIERDHTADFRHHKTLAMSAVRQNARHFRRRIAVGRTESYRLIGRCYRLLKSKTNAMKWYEKSIQEGQRLKAEIELAKTLDEVEHMRNPPLQSKTSSRND